MTQRGARDPEWQWGWLTDTQLIFSVWTKASSKPRLPTRTHQRTEKPSYLTFCTMTCTEAVLVCSLFYPDPRREWGESGKHWCSAPVSCAHLLYLLKSVKGDSWGGADSEVSSWVEPESMTSSQEPQSWADFPSELGFNMCSNLTLIAAENLW